MSAAPIPTNDKRLPLNGTSTRSRLPLPFALSSVSCGMATANQQLRQASKQAPIQKEYQRFVQVALLQFSIMLHHGTLRF